MELIRAITLSKTGICDIESICIGVDHVFILYIRSIRHTPGHNTVVDV